MTKWGDRMRGNDEEERPGERAGVHVTGVNSGKCAFDDRQRRSQW